MTKARKKSIKRTKNILFSGLMILLLLVGAAAIIAAVSGEQDRKRAAHILSRAKQERENLSENIENPDRDTFLTTDGKVVVGFIRIPSLNVEYAVLNTFDKTTAAYSIGREDSSMPWDAEGMTVYGIPAFTKHLSELQEGDSLIFEDLAGTEYSYQYQKEPEEKVIDHGIRIISSDKDKNEKASFQFVLCQANHIS